MNTYRSSAQIFLLIVLLSTGCRKADLQDGSTRILVDGLGRDVAVPLVVNRVVTMAPSVTELVAVAGGFERIVGVSNADNYPPEVSELPKYSALPINFEAIAALEPDLILATTQVNDQRDADTFETLGIPIFYLSDRNLDEVIEAVEIIGMLLGCEAVSEQAADSLRIRVRQLELASAAVDLRPTVLFLVSIETLYSFGPESYVHDLIELAGGISVTAEIDVVNPVLSDEFVLRAAPDIIIGTFGESFVVADLLEAHPTWEILEAVRNGHVYSIDGDLTLRAGPRIVDGAYQMHELLQRTQRP